MERDKARLYSVEQRYNFESNLQPGAIGSAVASAVFGRTKIQFWKQFTTINEMERDKARLYSVEQRYNFESNLQRSIAGESRDHSCIR